MGPQHRSLKSIIMATKKLTYSDMVLQSVLNIKDYRKGASRAAIKKYVEVTFDKVVSASAMRNAIKKLVEEGALLQEGQRFKLEKTKRAELRKPAPKPKKKKPAKKKTKKKAKKKTKKKTVKKKKTTKKKKPAKKKTTKKKKAAKKPKKTTKKKKKKKKKHQKNPQKKKKKKKKKK